MTVRVAENPVGQLKSRTPSSAIKSKATSISTAIPDSPAPNLDPTQSFSKVALPTNDYGDHDHDRNQDQDQDQNQDENNNRDRRHPRD